MRSCLLALPLLLVPAVASAQEFVDPRVVGMGGVATAFADDSSAIHENPAALWRLERWRVEAVTAMFLFSEDAAVGAQELDRIISNSNNADQVRAGLSNLTGKKTDFSGAFQSSFTMKGLGVALLANTVGDVRVRNAAYPHIEGSAGAIGALVASGAYGFLEDALSFGMSLSIGKRAQFADVVGPATAAHGAYDFEAVTREAFGVVGTFGVQAVGPYDWAPRIGVTVKNAFGFNLSDPAPIFNGSKEYHLENISPEIAVAVGTSKEFGPVRLRLGLGHDDLKTTQSPFLHLHMGAEGRFFGLVAVRTGLWQGYFTAGVGLDFRYVRLEAATYEVERGAYAGQNGDRRYVFQIALGL